ncbi:hypothetical protein [Caulobacter sp. NIBR1757]|uniref:hypothetical protein n=1 Tax=Caulobacter sp. NIBR1757 TaxID=3016000 RepID=UPI0022F071BC|nr:hypothetical protein [Caulobacter sp. NIBR1757]WGM39844.1 hypothetical protein AMEJIAPC_02784 [Caulobacter sp. NIBR1757]
MFRTLLVAVAAMMLTACVTPRAVELQNPSIGYKASDKVLVGVVEDRPRVKAGKPNNFAGFARVYGAPMDWTVNEMTLADKTAKGKSMSLYLAERIAAGLKSGGADVMVMAASGVATDAQADEVLAANNAGVLLTVVDREWHFDVNTNWVGKFRFDSELELVVQRRGKGTVLRKTFKDSQAVQAEGDESWPNLIVDAYKAKLEEIFSDAEVKAALAG